MKHYPKLDPCTVGYLRLVTHQLKLLDKLLPNEEIKKYFSKLSSYDKYYNILKMYFAKFKALKQLKRL